MIVSQRLARKLCPICKERYKANDKIREDIVGKIGKYMKNKDEVFLYRAKE
jgi:type II secretory ATPase GspE/PulE/Tfp pilus assembly ATPase PilB-like protein